MSTDNAIKLLEIAKTHDLNTLKIREIGRMMNPLSPALPQTVKFHWQKQYRLGNISYLPRPRAKARQEIKNTVDQSILGEGTNLISIPVRGVANCGPASHFADDVDEGYIHISTTLLKPTKKVTDLYAILASGESMNRSLIDGRPINDGDYVIVDRTVSAPEDGDRVVAIVNGLANIKRFYRERGRIVLVSESSERFDPIFIHPEDQSDNFFAGKVVQVVKKPNI